MSRLLFVAAEAYPLVKTGGLGDVAGCLPEVLRQQGMDVRLLIPAYADALEKLPVHTELCQLQLGDDRVQLLQGRLPGTGLDCWLVQHPTFSERPGDPYHGPDGEPWHDNAWRYTLLCRAAEAISLGHASLEWRPDILHCNDWHTGLAIALVHRAADRPRTVFTIHNLVHQGVFDRASFEILGLPEDLWNMQAMEYYGGFSFMKGGLSFADDITTVSPSYAREICSAPAGHGLEDLLSYRSANLHGILNGIDENVWNPATDPLLARNFDADSLDLKSQNRAALQRELGLTPLSYGPMIGLVGRLVEQKGIQLILPILEHLLTASAQVVILGSGQRDFEKQLSQMAERFPATLSVTLGYNEGLAHRIEASADLFLMPSLFEPCGLNQLYSLRYGTLPVVRGVGGLADTVVNVTEETLAGKTATGFVFYEPDPAVLLETLRRAMALWHDAPRWRSVQLTAMAQDFSWRQSAGRYRDLYESDTEHSMEY